jgi:Flp pilus assembly protein TadD
MMPRRPMDPGRWRRIETILDQVLDLPSEEQGALLDEACAGDPDLRAEVEALLAADEGAEGFLGMPAADLLAEDDEEEGLAGCRVGPYRLLREVGSGGMGTVYEAEDERLGRRVAVKLLPAEYSRDPRAKKRFLREARAASAVDHPNLCTVHDVGESDGRVYIVLSLYEGETLRERIQRGPLPFAEARDVALQVARGLARAHEAGIIHRDIKPANVMLTRRGEVKILDFGIARLESDETSLTRTGAAWGTPAYMSPEQARGEPVDCRTDIWSLGVLLFEMVAGRRPHTGEIVTEPLERLRPDVPPELARVVARALARDPCERYASATELLSDLESGPIPLRRGRRTVLRAGLLLGALAALLLLIFVLSRQPWPFAAAPVLRVAVLRPAVTPAGDDPKLASVSSEVMEAALATLVSLEGLQPLDPPAQDEGRGSELERRRAAEADEVLLPLLDCQGDWCRVTLRRLRKDVVLDTAGPFDVPAGTENAQQLAEGVRVNLQRIYPDHPPSSKSRGGQARSHDYATYIELERRVDAGERLGAGELARLDALLRTSPGLVGAYVLAAVTARHQGDLDRAFDYAVRAEEIAPHDPRPLFIRFRIEVEGRRFDAARATLARLTERAPADARVRSAEADLLEAQGELKKALLLRKAVAERRPTWRQILELATLEYRLGASDSARRRLGDLLKAQPENQYVRQNLATLEALSGDLERAATLYEELIRVQPARPDLTNLGFVRYLLGDYTAAAAAHRRALELEPDHLLTRFNLGTALQARGDLAGARHLYRILEKELAAASTPLDGQTRMLHAQCFARLGRRDDALRLADEVLEQRPEEIQVLNLAAQLYALLGERLSALFYTELALKKGLRREWFTIPEFHSLEKDPDFRALLDSFKAHRAA